MMITGAKSMSPEILHCLGAAPDSNSAAAVAIKGAGELSVLERQRAVLKWQQDQLQNSDFSHPIIQHHTFFNDFNMLSSLQAQSFHGGLFLGAGDTVLTRPVKADPGLDPGSGSWPDYGAAASGVTTAVDYSGGVNYAISRTASCPPVAGDEKVGKENFKKRKADNKTFQPPKAEDESRAKKVKGCSEEDEPAPKNLDRQNSTKNSNNTKNGSKESRIKDTSAGSSKENSKASDLQKSDFIHVRARRGQATDSHSLAERVRREKISERMKYLQDLVPGCNKITGKAGMLDEIINYVQSLQRQVEFLSMKLAAVNPRLDFNIEDLFAKEAFAASSSNFPPMCVSSEMASLAYLQYSQGHQMGLVSGSDLSMNEVEMGIRRTISAPVSLPETFLDPSCLTQIQSCLPWDQSDLQNFYNMELQQARQQSFPSPQTYTGAN